MSTPKATKRASKSKASNSTPALEGAAAEASDTKRSPAKKKRASKKKRAPKQAPAKKTKRAKAAPAKKTKRAKAAPAKKTKRRAKAAPDPSLCPTTGALLPQVWSSRFRELAERSLAEGTPLTLALVDVDGFRHHQSELETERADALLRGLVLRINDAFSEVLGTGEALLGRLAGDLFALSLPNEIEEAMGLLALARKQIQRTPLKVGRGVRRREVSPTLSAGLASLRRDGSRAEELLGAAQGALWRAKSLGGDRLGLPDNERMTLKSSYYPQTQLDQLKALARQSGTKESALLREALGDLFLKYKSRAPESSTG